MFFHKRETNSTVIPTPVSLVPASGFDGNDGRWSTFMINVGDNGDGRTGQNFKVLISTSSPLTQIPITADWCTIPDEETCAANRGVEMYQSRQYSGFQRDRTEQWRQIGIYGLPPIPYFDEHPDPNLNASYGTVTVGLGPTSKDSHTLAEQTVAGVKTRNFFMGSFGLGVDPVDFGAESPVQPFLYNFRQFNQIPSLSYGYTAGAHYRKCSFPITVCWPARGSGALIVLS